MGVPASGLRVLLLLLPLSRSIGLPLHLQTDTYNHVIRRINLLGGTVTTFAGSPSQSSGHSDGVGSAASFANPTDIAVNSNASVALVVSGGDMGAVGDVLGLEVDVMGGVRLGCSIPHWYTAASAG